MAIMAIAWKLGDFFFLEDTATGKVIVIAVVRAGLSGLLMWFRTQDEEH